MTPYTSQIEQSESLTIKEKEIESNQDNLIASYNPYEGLSDHSIYTERAIKESLYKEFESLKNNLLADTKYSSDYASLLNHPAHLKIVSFGEKIIPFLVIDMVENKTPWFYALIEITGINPIRKKSRGKIDRIIEDWHSWACENNYV